MATKEFYERIRRYKVFLEETLCEEADVIVQHAQQENIITLRDYRNLKDVGNSSREKMIIDMLDKVTSKGEDTCHQFIALLRRESITETFPLLKNHNIVAPSNGVQDNLKLPGQPNGPRTPAFTDTSLKYPDDNEDNLAEIKQYKITQRPPGTCVIINNVHFQTDEREGSDVDQNSLEKVFKWLGFDVVVHRDKTAAQIKALLQDLGKKVNGDCFICCILSHGNKDGISGIDSRTVNVNDIREPFDGINCKNLAGKPKLFFIQACRGSKENCAVKVQADDSEGDESDLEEEDDSFEIIPADSDFLIARSTIDGYKSKRNRKNGSRFIQSLCQQLETHCPQGTDINTILLHVNNEVSQKGNKCKQMPVFEVALRKKLILPVPSTQ
ncbi:caspase-3-like [Paramisgurnus dabryanus]|uniref:caspase-3-like n=1 Tax=Paramisgurnus dabryanus TaxID=90735 RepID=UPI0031F3A7FB